MPISAVIESAEDAKYFSDLDEEHAPKYLSGSSWIVMQETTTDSWDMIPTVTLPLGVIAVLPG